MVRYCDCYHCREARRHEPLYEDEGDEVSAAVLGFFVIVLAFVVYFVIVVQL